MQILNKIHNTKNINLYSSDSQLSFFNLGIGPLEINYQILGQMKRNIDKVFKQKLFDTDIANLSISYCNEWKKLTELVFDMEKLSNEKEIFKNEANVEALEKIVDERKKRKEYFFSDINHKNKVEQNLRNNYNIAECRLFYKKKMSKLNKKMIK